MTSRSSHFAPRLRRYAGRVVGTLGLLAAALIAPTSPVSAFDETGSLVLCGSVEVNYTVSGGWRTYTFVDSSTGEPVVAKLRSEESSAKDNVLVLFSDRWTTLHTSESTTGTALRIAADTYARISFIYENCSEIIEPKDK